MHKRYDSMQIASKRGFTPYTLVWSVPVKNKQRCMLTLQTQLTVNPEIMVLLCCTYYTMPDHIRHCILQHSSALDCNMLRWIVPAGHIVLNNIWQNRHENKHGKRKVCVRAYIGMHACMCASIYGCIYLFICLSVSLPKYLPTYPIYASMHMHPPYIRYDTPHHVSWRWGSESPRAITSVERLVASCCITVHRIQQLWQLDFNTSIHPSVHPSVRPSVRPSIHPSIHPSPSLSISELSTLSLICVSMPIAISIHPSM